MPVKKRFNLYIMLLLLLGTVDCYAQNFRQIFGSGYERAEQLANAIRPQLQRYARTSGTDWRMLEAIVFPELIRYDAVFDALEQGSLYVLYARAGSGYGNFSIGYFQMKPDYAESLEKAAGNAEFSVWRYSLEFNTISSKDDYENRVLRLQRLGDTEWQIRYLILMVKIVAYRYPWLLRENEEYKLRFLAAAYNSGWDKEAGSIKSHIGKACFFTHHITSGRRYVYSAVAWYRYCELRG